MKKKEHVEIQGSIKKEVEFPRQGCSRKTHVEFPWVLVFDLGISKACFLSGISTESKLSLLETLDSFHEFFQLYFGTFKN